MVVTDFNGPRTDGREGCPLSVCRSVHPSKFCPVTVQHIDFILGGGKHIDVSKCSAEVIALCVFLSVRSLFHIIHVSLFNL